MHHLVNFLRKTGCGALIVGVALPVTAHIDVEPDRPVIAGSVPNAVIVGPGERVEFAMSVDCNLPQVPVDGYVVPMLDRSLKLELVAKSSTRDGLSIEYVESLELVSGSGPTFYEPEPNPGGTTRAITISVAHVEYRGHCDLNVSGRIAGPDGESRATIGPICLAACYAESR